VALLQDYLEGEIRTKIREYARALGGFKANGDPFTEQDVEETLQRVKERMASGQVQQVLQRTEGGVIIHRGRTS
jgi:hypothetical protein